MAMLDEPGNTRYPAALSCKPSGTLLHRRMLSKSMFIRLATGCLTHRDAKIPAQVTTRVSARCLPRHDRIDDDFSRPLCDSISGDSGCALCLHARPRITHLKPVAMVTTSAL